MEEPYPVGRKNKAYSKDLHQQAYDRLTSMQAFGESKKAAVATGTDKDKIFSFNTYQTYWKHTKYFIKVHPGAPPGMHHAEKRQEVRQRVVTGAGRPGPVRLDGAGGGQGPGQALRHPAG